MTIFFIAFYPSLIFSFPDTITIEQTTIIKKANTELIPTNPNTKALGERIVGSVLIGTGALALTGGAAILVYNRPERILGAFIDIFGKFIAIVGVGELGTGAVMLSIGFSKYNKWKDWENLNTIKSNCQPTIDIKMAILF